MHIPSLSAAYSVYKAETPPVSSQVTFTLADSNSTQSTRYARVYEGNDYTLNIESEEQAVQIDNLLDRLNESQQKQLIDSGLLNNEQFMALSDELDDKQLGQLLTTIETLSGKGHVAMKHMHDGTQRATSAAKLLDVLSEANDSKRSRILDYAEKLAAPLIKSSSEGDLTYDKKGLFNLSFISQGDRKNSLDNFITVLGETKQVHLMMNKLETFGDAQQNQLLSIMALDNSAGIQLMDQLSEKSAPIQAHFLSYLGKIAGGAREAEYGNPQSALSKRETSEAGEDIRFSDVATQAVKDIVELINNYEFSDQQLLQMGEDLSLLNKKHDISEEEQSLAGKIRSMAEEDSSQTGDVIESIRTGQTEISEDFGAENTRALTQSLDQLSERQLIIDQVLAPDATEMQKNQEESEALEILRHQRAYIAITRIGLEHLTEEQPGSKVSSEEVTQALESISDQRFSHNVRENVFLARYAEEVEDEPGVYHTKHNWKADEDMKNMVLHFLGN